MRVITGILRGRKLMAPKDRNTRPTTDKVKEAIFSIIEGEYFEENVMDLFAGTGNLGIEAFSRGAKHVFFGDNSRESLRVLKENVKNLNIEENVTIYAGDYENILKKIKEKSKIIFLDPPYGKGIAKKAMKIVDQLDLLESEGLIIVEHDKNENFEEKIENFKKIKEKIYGKIVISFYTHI